MSVVSHIAAQRTEHGVPHAMSARLLGVSESWFYKWRNRRPTATERRHKRVGSQGPNRVRDLGSNLRFTPSTRPTTGRRRTGLQKDRRRVHGPPRPGSTPKTAP